MPGEFRTPHSLAFDARGRLFVADRGNHRLQIFDQDGKLLDTWLQFGRVSGVVIVGDRLYTIDSESNATRHPGWKTGIRIGRARKKTRSSPSSPRIRTMSPMGPLAKAWPWTARATCMRRRGPNSRAAAGGGLTKYVKQ